MAATVNITVGSHAWVEEPVSSSTNKKKEKQVLPWIDGQVIHIQTTNGKKVVAKVSKVYPKDNELLPAGVDDMTKLTHVHEPGVLQNLATRYQLNKIYTYVGNILIAINPFHKLPHSYDTTFGQLSPRVVTVANVAYRSLMMKEGKSTSIIVSGASGAGKTETTKMLMRHLAYVGGRSGTGPTIEKRLPEIGRTKIFLKDGQALDARRREVLSNAAITIQRQIRICIARRRKEFVTLLVVTIHLQSLWRGKLACKLYEYLRREAAAVKIQKTFRRYVARKRYIALQLSAVTLQTCFRAMAAHKEFKSRKQIKAAMRNQAKTQEISKLNNALSAKQIQLDDAEARIEGLKKKLQDAADAAVCEVDQLKESVLRLVRKLSEAESENQLLSQERQPIIQDNQDALIECISQHLGYSGGRPVAACLIYICLLHWRSFDAEITKIFDRIIQIMGSVAIEAQDNNDVLAYWLSNSSTLLSLQKCSLNASGAPSLTPRSSSRLGRIFKFALRELRPLRQIAGLQCFNGQQRQVEAKCPALLFKQQLIAFLEKIYGTMRDNLKKDISQFLELCIQAPRTSTASLVNGHPQANAIAHWQSIVKILNSYLNIMKANSVSPFLVRKLFSQIFYSIHVQLFNSLLSRRECCSFSNGEYVKAGLAELEQWCFDATEVYAGSARDELVCIRQAVDFLVTHEKPEKTLEDIPNDVCPVISSMIVQMTEHSNNAVSSSFLSDDDSSIPFSVDDISKSMQQIDINLDPLCKVSICNGCVM